MPVRNWHLTIAYDGTRFHGWQIQPGPRTVQHELQTRLRILFHDPQLLTAGTSRTDAGVHALDQHVSFAVGTPPEFDATHIRRTLNRWLPEDVKILDVAEAPPEFHARHSACGKAYTYAVYAGEKSDPLWARFVWHSRRPLCLEAMQEAAAAFVGEHDFSSFAVNSGRADEVMVKTMYNVEVLTAGDLVCFSVVGNSFLYRMVRSMVGYLVHVGQGRATPADVARVLAAKDRCAAAESAPPQGLFLMRVFFQPGEWRDYRPTIPPFAGQR
ncbi:MAG: tRNA pseudouridine(38-40) synthase TruA [Lentisphaerae bacterium RIFOXYB12_FULL_65_16]|nr:MAG: tRNA pseudouridine(38-40) synthase TruA [Lentisphaerae bacterium RIFOXYA12_64_32]OGV88007.1 MAG: tRNA pseudouridine(38-40) synthase TruA [Lentisphaerae bacterium RIFOXYB12_FULL_65_16]